MNAPQTRTKNRSKHRRHRQPRGQRPESLQPQRQLGAPYQPPKAKSNTLRVYGLGGLEEVGRNCTVFEYQDSIVIVDLGLQFPEEDMPGIDYIIPNITSLRGKERNIKGIIITHGHYDHIGGIPHLADKLGNPPIYGLPLTHGIIKRRQDDFQNAKLNLRTIRRGDKLQLGQFKAEFFGVSHNIPDSMGVVLHTPVGTFMHTGDFKLDPPETGANISEINRIREFGRRGITALFMDSTNATKPGRQLTEKEIEGNIEEIIRTVQGRLIIGTFSSLLSRLAQIIRIAEKHGKKIIIEGYSMRMNVEIAKELGYIQYRKETIIPVQQEHRYPPNKVIILCTGAQGEERAVLMRIANREHRFLRIQKGDTVLFSSSVVPGNERSVQRLTDGLYLEGADVINYQMMDVHAGGHAMQDDLKSMLNLVRPKYLVPIEGNYSFRMVHGKVAVSAGMHPKNIFVPRNGQILEFTREGARLTNESVPTDYVFVDGLGVGDISNVVLRDRQQMAEDGMVVIIATVEGKTGNLVGSPDVITRGFVHVKENFKLINEIKDRSRKILVDRDPNVPADDQYLRNKLRDSLGQFLFTRTERRPMVLPVIMEV